MVKALNFQSSDWTNNCQIEVLFKWLGQACTPLTASVGVILKQGVLEWTDIQIIGKICELNMLAYFQKSFVQRITRTQLV